MSLMPNYLMKQFELSGKPNSFGFMYFYQSGTMTPKAVYADVACTIPLTNPVQLDSSGSAVIFLGTGAYRIWLKDRFNQQIVPYVDGIVSDSASNATSNATYATLQTYQDLRTLGSLVDFVYICGRDSIGDGGAGLFQRQPQVTTDDDGIILNASSGTVSYKRVFGGTIDPVWYGVKYGIAIDNSVAFNKTLTASTVFNKVIEVTGSIFLSQNITIPSYSELQFNEDGYLVAGSAVTVTFNSNSSVNSSGRCFGAYIQPKFNQVTVDEIKLSWFGGISDDDRFTKLLAATLSTSLDLVIDESITVSSGIYSTVNPISFINKSVITFNNISPLALTFTGLVPNDYQMFSIPNAVSIPSINFGTTYATPDMFGANGVVSTDQYKAVYCALITGKCKLLANKSYSILSAIPTLPALVNIVGQTASVLNLGTGLFLVCNSLTISNIGITLMSVGNWLTATTFTAYQSNFPSTYTATVKMIDGCGYTDDVFGSVPVYDGKPQIYNAHLPLLPYAPNLKTDGVGKIYSDYKFKNGLSNWNVEYADYASNKDWYFNCLGQDATNLFAPSNISTDNSIAIKNKYNDSPMLKTTYTLPTGISQGYGYYCFGIKFIPAINKYVGFWQTFQAGGNAANIIMTSSNLLAGTWTAIYTGTYSTSTQNTFDNILQANDGTIWTSIHNTNTYIRVTIAGAVELKTYSAMSYVKLVDVKADDQTKIVALASNSLGSFNTVAVSSNSGSTWQTYSHGSLVVYFDAVMLDSATNIVVCGSDNAVCSVYKFASFPSAPVNIGFDSYGVGLTNGSLIKGMDYINGTIVTNGNTNMIYTSINGGYNFTKKYQGTIITPSINSFAGPSIYIPEIQKVYVNLGYQQIISGD